ncbi:hypothetical protein CAPTEDRAFT_192573 [Capitella teleta]|uniref:Uncharacterized protein n=1 Tax=Capitella teleta TaxID=283909 RepID=R7V8S6_CAPTE|nr:hypothetical protein CAPTEDRAFT_192573 [Capitella teleta]|eukprot:ELU12751.1 hypothetical protein CAPTEDRAFT_192573 [Capitella teleta]
MVVFERMMARMSFENEHGMCDSPVMRDVSGNAETWTGNRNYGCHHHRMHEMYIMHHHHDNNGHSHHHGFHDGRCGRFSRGHDMKYAFGGKSISNNSFHGQHCENCHAKKCLNVEEAKTPVFVNKCAGFQVCRTKNGKNEHNG